MEAISTFGPITTCTLFTKTYGRTERQKDMLKPTSEYDPMEIFKMNHII